MALPSLQEAFGAVTGEALSAGCPVVVSERAGSAFLVKEGESGSVVDPLDTEALADALRFWTEKAAAGRPLQPRDDLLPVRFDTLFKTLAHELLHP